MERLVIRVGSNTAVPCKFDLDFAIDLDKKTWNGLKEIFDALADVYDILGENYNLDRLREIVQADRDGRCVVLPVPLHSVLLDMSDTSRPDVLKDFRISATWTHNGIVFYCPWNIFNQNIEKGFIRLMSESATAMLEGEAWR